MALEAFSMIFSPLSPIVLGEEARWLKDQVLVGLNKGIRLPALQLEPRGVFFSFISPHPV